MLFLACALGMWAQLVGEGAQGAKGGLMPEVREDERDGWVCVSFRGESARNWCRVCVCVFSLLEGARDG